MKLLLVGLFTVMTLAFAYGPSASAVNVFPGCASKAAATSTVCSEVAKQTKSGKDPLLSTLKKVIDLISYIIGVASIIVIIISGIQMVTGGSNAQTVSRATSQLIFALVGIVVAVLAQTIVVFVLDNLK